MNSWPDTDLSARKNCALDTSLYSRAEFLNQGRSPGPQLWIQWKSLCQFVYLPADSRQHLGVFAVVERFRDPGAHLHHLSFFHASGGECWRPNANAAGFKRRVGIKRNGILVDGDG